MDNLYDLIIIGAGAAGCSAAIYAGRAKLKTLLLDQGSVGGQIRITNDVVNYPGILQTSGAELAETMRKQVQNFGAQLQTAVVQKVDFSGKLKTVTTPDGEYQAVAVLLATGAVPRQLGFPGEETFRGHGVGYCATCDGEFFTGQDIFVIGGGFAAAEEALFLTRYASHVHVIVREPEFTCSASIGDKVKAHPNITVYFNTEITALEGDTIPRLARFTNNETGEAWQFTPTGNSSFGVFVFAGYVPQSSLFKGQIELDSYGYIPTNEELQTNVPGVFAAGDIRPKELRQLATAVSDGAIAATVAERYIAAKKEELGLTIHPQQASQPENNGGGLIDESLAQQLTPFLAKFQQEVTVVLHEKAGDPASQQAKEMLTSLASLSSKVQLSVLSDDSPPAAENVLPGMRPAITLQKANGEACAVRYYGVPSGHEFNSFLLALYNAAGPGQTLPKEIAARIAKLQHPHRIQVGMSLSCTLCPDVVQAAQQISFANPLVALDSIDVMKFPDYKNQHNILSVPAILIDDEPLLFGKKSIEELLTVLEKLDNTHTH